MVKEKSSFFENSLVFHEKFNDGVRIIYSEESPEEV